MMMGLPIMPALGEFEQKDPELRREGGEWTGDDVAGTSGIKSKVRLGGDLDGGATDSAADRRESKEAVSKCPQNYERG